MAFAKCGLHAKAQQGGGAGSKEGGEAPHLQAGAVVEAALATSKERKQAVESWSCETLHEWLGTELQLSELAAAALEQQVDGSLALEMDATMWRELGATGLTPARIARDLKRLAKRPA
jgi:hypothetical protein